jgi:methanethiol S-methyltransferase
VQLPIDRWRHVIENVVRLGTVAVIWIAWCLQHSLLNSDGPIRRTSILHSRIGRYYRLLYVLVSIITLSLVIWAGSEIKEYQLWRWPDWLRPVQAGIWIIAIVMFWLSSRRLDLWRLMGVRALVERSARNPKSDELVTTGIYGCIRHPQFLAGLMVLWARDLTDRGLVTTLVLSGYLIIGARIEESRLLTRLGDRYRRYYAEVPGFIPRMVPRLCSPSKKNEPHG